jgi:cyclase
VHQRSAAPSSSNRPGRGINHLLTPGAIDSTAAPGSAIFSWELELDVGGREVRLIEVGPAHTPGDLIVWVPDTKMAIAADILFIGVTPIMWARPLQG